ncbi:hypothetical protein V8E53_009934 [Lactarius tabidus]
MYCTRVHCLSSKLSRELSRDTCTKEKDSKSQISYHIDGFEMAFELRKLPEARLWNWNHGGTLYCDIRILDHPLVHSMDTSAVFYDPRTFRKYFRNVGLAYREQATTLIEICRLYAEASPHTYTEYDHLINIFRLADAALNAAGKAKRGTTDEATDAFLRVQDEITHFCAPPPRKDTSGDFDHRKRLPDPRCAMEAASKKDEKSVSAMILKVKSTFKAPEPKGLTMKVNFVIRKSPHRHNDQLIVHQEINNPTITSEIMWRFCRYPKNYPERITLKQNPHFYLQLPLDAASYDNKFKKDPLKDFTHSLKKKDTIYVLLDKSCRLFLDAARPHIPRIFGNLWKPYHTVILKDVFGNLESEDIALRGIGESQDYWYRIVDPSRPRVESSMNSEIVNLKRPIRNVHDLLEVALRSQNIDLMIRDRSRPKPPTDSGWKRLPSQEPSPGAQIEEPEGQTTPTQSNTQLQLEDPNPDFSVYSFDSSSIFSTSTESFETVVNDSDYLPTQAAASVLLQTVDSEIDQVEVVDLPTPDSIPSPSLSDSLPDPLPELRYSNPNLSTPSISDSSSSSTESLESLADLADVFLTWATTSRQSDTRLPPLEYSNTGSRVYSFGGGTTFATSTESLETVVDASEGSLPTQLEAGAGEFFRFVDSDIKLQVEPPAADGPSSDPLVDLSPGLRYSNPNLSTPSISSTISSGSSSSFISTGSLESSANEADAFSPWATTSRQSDTRLPQLEYPNPSSHIYSFGGGATFATSTESLETVVNASKASLPTQAATGEFSQSVDNLHVEPLAIDGLPTLPSSDPLVGLLPELRYSNPNSSTPSFSSGSSSSFISTGSSESWDNI